MHLLLVEDEAPLSNALMRGLVAEGHAVDIATDGAEALWYAAENTYDVIVLDVMIPILSGDEVAFRAELDPGPDADRTGRGRRSCGRPRRRRGRLCGQALQL